MTRILNLTQHPATLEQVAAGVVELNQLDSYMWREVITFESLEDVPGQIDLACERVARLIQAYEATHAMVGGAMWLMAPLVAALEALGVVPVYAFSKRESVETTNADGSVTKSAVFRHVGFVS